MGPKSTIWAVIQQKLLAQQKETDDCVIYHIEKLAIKPSQ